MKRLQLIFIWLVLLHLGLSAQQSIKCVKGDCKNGYSFATMLDASGNDYGYQVGFFENSKLNGIANQTGTFGKFWGSYINGVKNGFFSYETDGNLYAFGQFINGKKEGLHVIRNKAGYQFWDYKNDAHVSNSPLPTTGTSPCVMGNCENGKGVSIKGNDAVYSSWKNGKMDGMTMQFLMSESKIVFAEFTEGVLNGTLMVWYFDKTAEIMQMKNGQRHGQYLKREADNTHIAATYEEGVLVKSF